MATHVPGLAGDCAARIFQPVQERALRTLVVDDTPDVLEVICALLAEEDRIEVIGRATNGSEALEAIARVKPDLVVMDVQMPKMDGLTAAALIHSENPEISIMLMSADPFYQNEARASGADAFIHKVQFGQMFPRVLTQLTTAAQTRM